MKKLIAAFMFVFLALGCSDDNPETQNPNFSGTLTINGVSKTINKGYIIRPYTGTNPAYDKRRFYLAFSDGMVTLENNEFSYAQNVHQLVDFNLYASEAHFGTIENTIYNLYPNSGYHSEAFIDHSGTTTDIVTQNGEFVSGNELSSDDMNSGHITLSQEEGAYHITFSFENGGNTVTGSFTGTLTELYYQYE